MTKRSMEDKSCGMIVKKKAIIIKINTIIERQLQKNRNLFVSFLLGQTFRMMAIKLLEKTLKTKANPSPNIKGKRMDKIHAKKDPILSI